MSRFYQALSQATSQASEARLLKVINSLESESPAADSSQEEPPKPEPRPEPKVTLELVPMPKPAAPEPPPVYRSVKSNLPTGPLFPFDGAEPRIAEQYRLLRTNILQHPSRPKVIAISSASAGDGKKPLQL